MLDQIEPVGSKVQLTQQTVFILSEVLLLYMHLHMCKHSYITAYEPAPDCHKEMMGAIYITQHHNSF